jgi:hypothetical protein
VIFVLDSAPWREPCGKAGAAGFSPCRPPAVWVSFCIIPSNDGEINPWCQPEQACVLGEMLCLC